MPLVKLPIAPGVVKGDTELAAEGRWVDGDRTRFVGGLPEKIGGWSKLLAAPLTGAARAAHGWRDTVGNRRLAFGTHRKVQVYYDAGLFDITPAVASGNLINPFATTAGSAVVVVAHTAHGRQAGDAVLFAGATAVGGITVSGEYVVASLVDANGYRITHAAAASSTAGPGGGTVAYTYLLGIGRADDGEAAGFGRGGYGRGGYGVGAGAGLPAPCRTWSLTNYGQDLIAAPRGLGVYTWTPGAGAPSGRLVPLGGAPTLCNGAFVTDERMVMAYAVASDGGNRMRVAWSDESDATSWTPGVRTTAGLRNLVGGNELLGHQRVARGLYLIFSDTAAHLFQYTGDRFIYASRRVSDQAGLIGPKAACETGGIAYWMGRDQFWMFDGTVRPMPAQDVWDYVFRDLNLSQKNKCFAAVNSKFNEVWFFYCSSQSSEIDRYVIYAIDQRVWSVGSLERTCWFPRDIFDTPHATDAAGSIFQHETGTDADGQAMGDFITAAPLDLEDGNLLVDIDRIVPDFKHLAGTVQISLLARDKPGSALINHGPYAVTTATEDIDPDPRIDGRQIGLRIASSGTGAHWRLGLIRVNAQPAGGRL